jgi:hypothetical protein
VLFRNVLATEAPLLIATLNPKSDLTTCSNETDCNLVQELDQNVESGIEICKSASKQGNNFDKFSVIFAYSPCLGGMIHFI